MNCSRCGSTVPNPGCYVCWEEPEPERDAMQEAKEYEQMKEEEP